MLSSISWCCNLGWTSMWMTSGVKWRADEDGVEMVVTDREWEKGGGESGLWWSEERHGRGYPGHCHSLFPIWQKNYNIKRHSIRFIMLHILFLSVKTPLHSDLTFKYFFFFRWNDGLTMQWRVKSILVNAIDGLACNYCHMSIIAGHREMQKQSI